MGDGIATTEIVKRSGTGDIVPGLQKGIGTEREIGIERDIVVQAVSRAADVMSCEIETELGEEGETRAERETIGIPEVVEEGGEIEIETEGTGNDLEKGTLRAGLQEVEVLQEM